jgi:3-oxoacyl-[acyl-carrier-protein] synthase II
LNGFLTGIGWTTAGGMGRGKTGALFAPVTGQAPSFSYGDAPHLKSKRFGRLDTYSKIGLTAIAMALTDAGLTDWEAKRPIGIIAATKSGCLQTDADYFGTVVNFGGKLASPNLFAYTLPNAFIGEAGILFGLSGMGIAVNVPDNAETRILGLALESLAWGDDDVMLAGICELPSPVSPDTTTGSAAFGVFAVLEKNRRDGITPYGNIVAKENNFFYNEKRIDTFFDFITAISTQQRKSP